MWRTGTIFERQLIWKIRFNSRITRCENRSWFELIYMHARGYTHDGNSGKRKSAILNRNAQYNHNSSSNNNIEITSNYVYSCSSCARDSYCRLDARFATATPFDFTVWNTSIEMTPSPPLIFSELNATGLRKV